jgi:hypothetical protein
VSKINGAGRASRQDIWGDGHDDGNSYAIHSFIRNRNRNHNRTR